MQSRITNAILIALTLALIATAATCQQSKRTGELRTKEAQEEADHWKHKAGAYAEALERAEDAQKRAGQSTMEYLHAVEKTEERTEDARQIVDEMRESGSDCGWLDERVPDRVRDIIQGLCPGSDCD